MTIGWIIFIILALWIGFVDAKKRIIPDDALWGILLTGLYYFGAYQDRIFAAIVGFLIGYALMLMMRKKDALGFGDVKLISVIGLWMGINGMSLAIVLACVMGIVWGIWKKQKFVPFAPFLFSGIGIYFLIKDLL